MDQNNGSKARGRKGYTDDFRRSVVEHLVVSGKTASQVAAEFGITPGMVRMWKLRYGRGEEPADLSAPKTPEELARENRELRKEVARLMTQRDI